MSGELGQYALDVPRIILLADEHPEQVVTSTVWLSKQGLDIQLREVTAYNSDGKVLVVFEKTYPVDGVEELLLGPARRDNAQAVKQAQDRSSSARTVKDWTKLHDLIAALQPSEWTTYGDLADMVDSSPRAVGSHVSNCQQCPYGGHRVLTADGNPAEGFHWTDSNENRTCQQVLESEGLTFDIHGRTDATRQVVPNDLLDRL